MVNAPHRRLWKTTYDIISVILNAPLGANLLWLLFNPELSNVNIRSEHWAEEAIYSFRQTAEKYERTTRYHKIVDYMYQEFPSFRQAWNNVDEAERTGDLPYQRYTRTYKINHPEFGMLHVQSVRTGFTLNEGVIITQYIPVGQDCEQYMAFQKSVKERMTISFPYHPIEMLESA